MTNRRTPLLANEPTWATSTDFGSWDMPVEFEGTVRNTPPSGLEAGRAFDVSHVGEIAVAGPDAVALTQRLTTNDVAALDPGEAHYTVIPRGDGVMLDDTIAYRTPEPGRVERSGIPPCVRGSPRRTEEGTFPGDAIPR